MTEKEKRDAGLEYDANYDEALIKEMTECKDKCFEYNSLRPSQAEEKSRLIKEILGKTKESVLLSNYLLSVRYSIAIRISKKRIQT